MFEYDLLREQWAILALFSGLAFVVLTWLFFQDYLTPRKRKKEDPGEYETPHLSAWQAIPWSVKMFILAGIIYAIVYSIYAIINPNSW